MSNENTEIEVLPPSAVMSLERAAIDCQVATAHAYPRSLEMFKKRALSMATLDLSTAESCIYSRPVGGGKTAEGASIRLAEIVAASYGNLRVAARIIEQTPRYVKCEGVAHDLESNYAGKSECIEPTVKSNGEPYSEAQRAVVAKACLAKAYRDAVFKVVPKALCKAVIDAAIGVVKKDVVSLEDRRKRVKDWLKQIKVDDNRVFTVLNVKGWTEVTDEHLITLTGLKTAINEQDTTVEEAFPVVMKTPMFQDTSKEKTQEPQGDKEESVVNPIIKLRNLCKEAKIQELQVLSYLEGLGSIQACKSFEEADAQNPHIIRIATEQFSEIASKISASK